MYKHIALFYINLYDWPANKLIRLLHPLKFNKKQIIII